MICPSAAVYIKEYYYPDSKTCCRPINIGQLSFLGGLLSSKYKAESGTLKRPGNILRDSLVYNVQQKVMNMFVLHDIPRW